MHYRQRGILGILEVDEPVHLVDLALHALLANHLRRRLLCQLWVHPKELAQLRDRDVVVQLASAQQIVFDHRPAEDAHPILPLDAQLVGLEVCAEHLNLVGLEDALEVHLLQEGKHGKTRAPLVLIQRGQHATTLRPRGGQDGARDGTGEGRCKVSLSHLLARAHHEPNLCLRQIVVSQRRLGELALGIEDTCITRLELILQGIVLLGGST